MINLTKIRVACLGAGYFSAFHYDAWRRLGSVEHVASVDSNIEAARSTGLNAYASLEDMFDAEQPDLLDIITPPSTHMKAIQTAIKKGVSTIICQKPFCSSLQEARKATELAEKHDVSLVVHENFRFQPWYRTMKQTLDEGLIGQLHQVAFRLRTGDGQGADAYMERQPYFQNMDRFLIHETGIHWIDTFRYLMGEPSAVYADLRKMNPHIKGEDAGLFIMEFEAGKRAVFDANRHLDHKAVNCRTTLGECLLEGTAGTITLEGDGSLWLRKFGNQESTLLLEAYKDTSDANSFAGDCVFALQQHVVDALMENGEFENTARQYLRNMEIEEAIYQSFEQARKIPL